MDQYLQWLQQWWRAHTKKREQYCKRSELEVGEWPWNEAMLGPDAGLPTTAWL